ncbi:class I SAM-dependent methyltransferase [Rhodococcus sp. IEGM 1408]|uniref:class I SAM-dependent methyltransferase n=1 Tax=Rhodococcus sp. IEGM 1408 TaxID=3082220 RepID=UPI002954C02C|nr:class I SAM-dependent methyltransferase [Rhodococcus sp. IEGM 1408]MDV7999770.1 class I SAM-dependent methyltransferase [Rhodococcus sp. IEGM 1408]
MDASAWNARYLAQPDAWGTTPAARIVAEVTAAEDAGLAVGTSVDLACGDGRHARWLAAHGWQVEAVDFSEIAIEQARAKDSDDGRDGSVDWVVGDALTWTPDEPVDLVVIGFLHLDPGSLARVLRNAGGWLKPGGHLVYLGHAAENLRRGVGGPQDPTVLPGIADLASGAEGLEVVSLRHDLRPAGKATAVDVLLHARSWVER